MEMGSKVETSVRAAIVALLIVMGSVFGFLVNAKPTTAVPVQASNNIDASVKINAVLSLAVESCDTGAPDYQTNTNVVVQPGKQNNQCQNVTVATNASGGYSLTMAAASSNLTHTTIAPSPPVIPSTTGTIASPAALADTSTGTWGFAVPKTQTSAAKLFGSFNPTTSNFDATYAAENNANSSPAKYAAFPTSTTTLAQTNQFSNTADTYKLWFASRIPANKPAGAYRTTITYTAVGEDLPEPEEFRFTIDTRMTSTLDTDPTHFSGSATSFAIPTSGIVNYTNHPYNWVINCGGGQSDQTVSGTSSTSSAGIICNYATPGEYQITIRSSTTPATPGWMNAFGFYDNTSGANVLANKNLFKSIDTPFTDNMRTPNSFARFASVFQGARNAVGIPANLFSNINTSSATDLSWMFNETFYFYARNSTTATIPAGLFDSINTSNATDLSSMFRDTFASYAYNSTVGTIPAGLFNSINLSSTDTGSINDMFAYTFERYAYANKLGGTPDTDINTIWGSANFAGKVTAANAADVFIGTFYDMPSLTGAAQTFINTKLGGINPTSAAVTFGGSTGITDLATLHANWK